MSRHQCHRKNSLSTSRKLSAVSITIRRYLPILDWIILGSRNILLLLCLSARRRVAKANLVSSMLHARSSADDDVAGGSRKEALMCAASYIDQEHGLVAGGNTNRGEGEAMDWFSPRGRLVVSPHLAGTTAESARMRFQHIVDHTRIGPSMVRASHQSVICAARARLDDDESETGRCCTPRLQQL